MSTMHKIDFVRGINARISEIQATTENLTLAEKKTLLESLSKDIQAAAQKADGPKRRLDSVKAASVSRDPRTANAYKRVTASLEALGYSIDSIAASGSLSADLERKMSNHRWDMGRKIALKLNLGIVGAIE
jgi:hypothetical protein